MRLISIKGTLGFPQTTPPLLFIGPMIEEEATAWLTANGFTLCGQHWLATELVGCTKDGEECFPRQQGLLADVQTIPVTDHITFIKRIA